MKYSIKISKLEDNNLKKFLKSTNSNAFTSTESNGLEKKIWDCFTLVIVNYLVRFRKERKIK